MTLQQLLDEFLFTKRLAGLEEGTVINYERTLILMVRYIGPNTVLSDLSFDKVSGYIMHLLKKGISKATVSSYIRNVKIFYRWIATEYELSFDPLKIKVPKSPKKIVHIYSDAEIRLIFTLVKTSVSWITARNRLIIALMLDSGLRQLEVCRLLHENINRQSLTMKVTGKGSKDRFVSLGLTSLQLLDDYMYLCPYKGSKNVFYDRRGNALSGNAIRLFVHRLESQLGFPLSSHKLRHNFATNFCIDNVRKTGNSHVYDLSILMGHESIETTKKYEHFAHEIIAAENSISHLDNVFKD